MGKGGGGFGAAAGAVFGGAPGAVVGGLMGEQNRAAAHAAQSAANAQNAIANRQYQQNFQMTEQPTVAAMLNFDQAIKAQERNLSRQEQLVAQIDPTIVEASQQALRLLRGEQSSTLAPLQQQRDQQRQKLLNTLRQQMGPGAETSSAGLQALTRFDQETSQLMAGAQQQSLANLGNIFGQFNAGRPDLLREASGLGSLGAGRQGLALNRVNALQGVQGRQFETAGSSQVGNLMRAQGNQAILNTGLNFMSNIAGQAFGKGMMGGGGT